MGRKKKYKNKYAAELVDYFSRFLEQRDDPGPTNVEGENGWFDPEYKGGDGGRPARGYPTLTKFALSIGVHKNTLYNWAKDNEDFAEAMAFASAIQDDILDERALTGRFDGRVAMKIRELKLNAKRADGDGLGGGLKIEIHKHFSENDGLVLGEWEGDVNEDTGYTAEN
ncbi:MAG: hypothetical protein E7649_06160 [Ruminococcaceae bacterium]|nr:hypothetical protein [Oscillospiraceae bacterium]